MNFQPGENGEPTRTTGFPLSSQAVTLRGRG